MELVSWNLAGRVSKCQAQVEALAGLGADILTLQETTARSRVPLSDALKAAGYQHLVDSFERAPDTSPLKGPRRYGELIASRFPLEALSPNQFGIPWPERVLSALVHTPNLSIELHTTHIPPGSSNGWIKIETFEGLFAGLAKASERPRILTGDFNTPQAELSNGTVVTWAQRLTERGVKTKARFRGGDGHRWDLGERNILVGLDPYDLHDVFRQLHGYERQEASWYTRNGTGRRFDHIFASMALDVRECDYIHGVREEGLSDHSPILAVFASQHD